MHPAFLMLMMNKRFAVGRYSVITFLAVNSQFTLQLVYALKKQALHHIAVETCKLLRHFGSLN